jgi:hypothetical protein
MCQIIRSMMAANIKLGNDQFSELSAQAKGMNLPNDFTHKNFASSALFL